MRRRARLQISCTQRRADANTPDGRAGQLRGASSGARKRRPRIGDPGSCSSLRLFWRDLTSSRRPKFAASPTASTASASTNSRSSRPTSMAGIHGGTTDGTNRSAANRDGRSPPDRRGGHRSARRKIRAEHRLRGKCRRGNPTVEPRRRGTRRHGTRPAADAGVGRGAQDHQHGRERRRNRDFAEHPASPSTRFLCCYSFSYVRFCPAREIAPGELNRE